MNTKQEKTKVIFIFGGVYSSLGKGIVVSSIAKILTNLNKKVSVLKFDPYLNVDPGAMAPGQHGEVYVTKDGAQTDLDLGHYERFIGRELTQLSSVTSGRIYNEIIRREREGKYNGKTVQVIPHVTNEIKERIYQIIQSENPDFLIIEVGGTVGDSESIPFTEAISQFVLEHGQENTIVCLVSPLISLNSTSGELKTKPTQHSIRQLRSLGVSPNFLILRSSVEVGQDTFEKIQLSSHIYKDNIFISPDLNSIYELPEKLYEQNIHLRIFNYFKIKYDKEKDTFKKNWVSYMNDVRAIKNSIKIALIGKYTNLHDAYASVLESLRLAGHENNVNVEIKWIDAETVTTSNIGTLLKDCNGVVVPGGFGIRGIEGMIIAINYVRTHDIPFIGICLGMQLTCIEFARNVLGIQDANSTEFSSTTSNPVIDLIDGTFQLGNYECHIKEKTLASKIYKTNLIQQRHRHRYALFQPNYIEQLEKNGLKISGVRYYNNKIITEFVECDKLKCFIGCQYHPELSSKPKNVDPFFLYFIKQSTKTK